MEHLYGTARLRHVAASDLPHDPIDFEALDVRNAAGDQLGEVEGFVLDRGSNRPYYVVVDSGGWFTSRHYLVPVGHARFDPANDCLRVDFDRDTIQRFPEVRLDRFDELSEEEARRFNEQTLLACCPTEAGARTGDRWDYDAWSHYRQPDWWSASAGSAATRAVPGPEYDTSVRDARHEVLPREPVFERERVLARERRADETAPGLNDRPIVAPTDRAQPGDVLGIETEGETTSLGDTARDEDERREKAEEEAREEMDEQRRKDRR